MKTLKVYGASDDLIEVDGFVRDEFGSYADTPYRGKLLVRDGSEMVAIHAIYSLTWAFAVTNEEDDEKLPDWPIRRTFGKDVSYSETLEIDVPDNATVEWQGC